MTPNYARSRYKQWLRETVYVRRLFPGSSPAYIDYAARARVTKHEPAELVNAIQQFRSEAIVYADDLMGNGLTLPITNRDKLVLPNGKVTTITSADDQTRKVHGELIAFEIASLG